ncbi:pyrroline-5-carboxylate reductase [Saliterribacillus persicus]|uniref:Pyrroline-5-carboxylate reductase n=1 Tax=Saliterribacillus persicus TaxID=930114 RepID=A0A368XC66_9BACI|nr:pyrroline-5-carboxylate reductase [Saliterribacillus persicus]RCW64588.1 pyrroline-5-carboxylate reductase [Saliterribacillus persicus]
MNKKIAFIGAGSMAEAIISGMVAKKIVPTNQIIATNHSNKERLSYLEEKYDVQTSQDRKSTASGADVVILAMKPKDIKVVLEELDEAFHKDTIVVSLLAGISTTFIEKNLSLPLSVIRVMPNTSAMIGESATTIAKGSKASKEDVVTVVTLMQSVGTTNLIEEEKMDAYTALAGSAPAFYYYMVEAMDQFAKDQKLDEAVSKQLMTQTIKGVAAMLENSEDTPANLRKKITSPGGTTEAGLKVLGEKDFQEAVVACLTRTQERSKELREDFEK